MTVRLTAPRPASYNLTQLRTEADAAAPGCRSVNEVDPDLIAGYWPDDLAPDETVWAQVVAAHQPVDPEPEAAAPEVVAAQVIREEIDTRLAPADVNSIAEMKSAIRDGLDAAVTRLGG